MRSIPINVLVVDDVAANRAALKAMLSRSGYNVVEAGSGDEALLRLLDQDYAMLLLDVVMPGMSGFELAEMIRGRDRTSTLPILYVTGQATDLELVFKGYRAGAVDYLVKPLDPEIVRAKVFVFAELYRQRKTLEAALREKEVLLREIHHRVKNNLQLVSSLLNLQGQRQSKEVRALLVDSDTRVRSIALIHEALCESESLAIIDTDMYLRSLVLGLVQTYGPLSFEVEIKPTPVRLPIDVATPCGLIVNELASNAIKHAFPGGRPGKLTVELRETPEDGFILEVCDTGIGIPADVLIEKSTSLGFQIVSKLAAQLGGSVAIDRTQEGTVVRVRFPKPETLHN